jgi:hypothetical protein
VSYLLTVTGGQQDTINEDDFTLLSASTARNYAFLSSNTTDACPIVKSFAHAGDYLSDYQWISWTGFTNHPPVRILWTNGVDITGISSNTVIVGQRVNLQVITDPPGIATSNAAWTIQGNAISNYVVASDSSSAQMLPLALTNSPTVSFYWVASGPQNISCTALLTNGMMATSQAGFVVQRPTNSLNVASVGMIACDTNFYLGGVPVTGPFLHFGDGLNNPGVLFTNIPDAHITGAYQWVQIATNAIRTEERNSGQWRTWFGSGLDFSYPLSTLRQNSIADSPGLGSPDVSGAPLDTNYVAATVQDGYDMYLMFNWNSSAVSTNDGWVPLKKVHWGWSAAASRTGSIWSLTSGSPVTPSVSDTTNYPAWSQIAQQAATWIP